MRTNRPGVAEEAFALAEELCGKTDTASKESEQGVSPCPEEVRREIAEHRQELRKRFPSRPSPPASNRVDMESTAR
jgi:hypothetical protein